jgi:hypothetical protein
MVCGSVDSGLFGNKNTGNTVGNWGFRGGFCDSLDAH